MATVLYIDPNQTTGLPRAAALGCGWLPSVPPQYAQAVASLPSVVVAGQGIVTAIIDNPPTTTAAIGTALAPILAAEQAAAAAAATGATNTTALQAALDARLGQIEAFIAANPNGAVLNAAQTLVVAKMLAGLTRITRNAINTTGQAG